MYSLPYTFLYTDGQKKTRYFTSPKEAAEWARNEGDHLITWTAGRD